jgi:beta-lactam-binding protein with PASTA domain
MGLISTGVSAITKLGALAVLLAAFGVGLAGVVYMSLSGKEVTVPELVGKDFVESEKELAALGLRIRRRADRPSTEKINTVVEQLPKPGETVKSGQWISVVVSRAGVTPEEAPKSLIKDLDEDDSKKIEEMISDKPKKAKNSNSNSNSAKKKADTNRDTMANTATDTDTGDKSTPAGYNTDKKDKKDEGDKPKSGNPAVPPAKPQQSPATKPAGEQRPRTTRP